MHLRANICQYIDEEIEAVKKMLSLGAGPALEDGVGLV